MGSGTQVVLHTSRLDGESGTGEQTKVLTPTKRLLSYVHVGVSSSRLSTQLDAKRRAGCHETTDAACAHSPTPALSYGGRYGRQAGDTVFIVS